MLIVVSSLHLTLCASWMGAMGYSLVAVQPKVAAYFTDDEEHEMFLARLAHGNRWRVVALIAAIAITGAAWVAVDDTDWVVQAVRGLLLAAAAGLFWWVSWRHWPRRVFALPEERPVLRVQLRAVAATMTALITVVFVLGTAILAAG